MARPKSYNREEALFRAVESFWEHGYGNLGVRAIEEQTSLNQFAIREEFGGKEGLYLEALNFYAAEAERMMIGPLRQGGLDAIDAFLADLADPETLSTSRWGCLVVNAGLENASQNRDRIAEVTKAYWQSLEDAFTEALRRAVRAGDVQSNLDVTETATALVTAVMGIHTRNRTGGSPVAGRPLIEMLRTWVRTL